MCCDEERSKIPSPPLCTSVDYMLHRDGGKSRATRVVWEGHGPETYWNMVGIFTPVGAGDHWDEQTWSPELEIMDWGWIFVILDSRVGWYTKRGGVCMAWPG